MPIAVPMPDKKPAAEGRPQHEGQGPQRERAGPREKRGRERGAPAPADVTPRAPNQVSSGTQHSGPPAADAGLAGALGAEQQTAGPPGVNRRGARSGRTQPGPRGERPAGQGVQSKEASVAEAVDAPPGMLSCSGSPASLQTCRILGWAMLTCVKLLHYFAFHTCMCKSLA